MMMMMVTKEKEEKKKEKDEEEKCSSSGGRSIAHDSGCSNSNGSQEMKENVGWCN